MVKEPCRHSTKLIRKCSYEEDLTVLNARWMAMRGEKEREGFCRQYSAESWDTLLLHLCNHSLRTMPPTQTSCCVAKCWDFLAAAAVAP